MCLELWGLLLICFQEIRNFEEAILQAMRDETARIQRENDNMETALQMIRARELVARGKK